MVKKPETVFRERATKDIETLKNCWHCSIQQVSLVGDPDKILCLNGHFVALEFKKDAKEKPKPLQVYNGNKIKDKGRGVHFFVHPENWDDIFLTLQILDRGRRE